jgi:hypothetical protein
MRYALYSLTLLSVLATVSSATVIYSEDFEDGIADGFSIDQVSMAPNGSTHIYGVIEDDSNARLSLTGIGSHTTVTVNFDLFIIQSWDGNNWAYGPDYWTLKIDGTYYVYATFTNNPYNTQSYSKATPLGGGPFPHQYDNDGIDILGFPDFYGTDSRYRMSFTFAHTGNTLDLDFAAVYVVPSDIERWAIDNVEISADVVPEPASLVALAAGLAAMRRRRA